jgi:uncharacterized paraquat-inducible protein A
MKRIVMITLVCAALVGFVALPALFAADAPKADIVMKSPGAATQGTVTFGHAKHGKQKCEDCHHKMKESKDMKCASCHNDLKEKKGDKSYYNAYHAPTSNHSCLGCHKSMKQGPTACNKCHAKK